MSFNAKDMTQGGQIASMRIRMFSQIANIMLYCLFIFFWILVGLILWVKISWQTFVNGCIYWWCTTLEGMRDLIRSQPVYEIQYYGKTFRMNAAQVLHDKYMIWCGEQLWSAFVLASVVALVICLITFFVVSWILGRQGKQQSENEVTGGRQLTDNPKDVARMLKKDGKDSDIRIGDLPIIRDVLLEDVAQRNIPLSHKKLRRALKAITRSESYLCSMKAGACRYDTEGYVTEHISQEEEAYAAARLDKIRRQNRIKAELQAVLDEK
ncbi:fertility inhibition protein FinO [Escherichia coli]|nr:fertility inhibition protein FinO [Escherichia coli]